MFSKFLTSIFVLVCNILTQSVFSSDLGEFLALHSRYGAHLGIDVGEIFEGFSHDLIKQYENSIHTGELDQDLIAEKIPIHWVHAVIAEDRAPKIADQAVLLLKQGIGKLPRDTVLSGFLLLDAFDRTNDVVSLWVMLDSQTQLELLDCLIARDSKYDRFAKELSDSAKDGMVRRQLSIDSSYPRPFRRVVDDYLLECIQRNNGKLNDLLPLIRDGEIKIIAQASCRSLVDSKHREIEQAFLRGQRDGILACIYRFEFANSKEMAVALLRNDFQFCYDYRSRGLKLAQRFPDLVDAELQVLATSSNIEDKRVLVQYFGGPRFRSLDDLPLVASSASSFVNATPNAFLTGVREWPITCSVFSMEQDQIVVSPHVLMELEIDKRDQLRSIATSINEKCRTTFFSGTLREAVVAIWKRKHQSK